MSLRPSRRHESVQMKHSIVRLRHQTLLKNTKESLVYDLMQIELETKGGKKQAYHEKVL
jgi:hypothetical protein